MSEILKPYKGSRDFYPEDKKFQKWMFGIVRSAVESFGYEEYDAPIIETIDLYRLKNQTNQEIIDEQIYSFKDRGDRLVALRPEMTPTVSRMVAARRQQLAYPLRWYSIPNLWRYERPQKGRLREHYQLNVDLFGVEDIYGDFEIIQIADSILKAFGSKRSMYTIRLNSRKFTDYLLKDYIKLDEVETSTIRRLIDRMHKMDFAEFGVSIESAINPSQREDGSPARLLRVLAAESIDELPDELKSSKELENLRQLFKLLELTGISNAVYDPTLMRGFDYYTDIVFEVFDTNPENNRSMFGGGRYDGLMDKFGVESLPTVGFGMGDVTLENYLRENNLVPNIDTGVHLYIALAGDVFIQSQKVIKILREEGVKTFVDITGRKLGKQIESASKKNIRYLVVLGEEELQTEEYKLKDLLTGNEEKHSIERIISTVLDERV